MLSDEELATLRAIGKAHMIPLIEAIRLGYGGMTKSGMIVDRRKIDGTPLPKSELFTSSEPKDVT